MIERDDDLRRAFAAITPSGFTEACPPADRLWAAAHGELPPEAVQAVTDHMVTCAACAEAWRAAREFGAHAGLRVTARTDESSRFPLEMLALAASIVAAVALGAWVLQLQRQNESLQSRLAVTTQEAESQVAAARQEQALLEKRLAELQQREPNAIVNLPFIELMPDALRGGKAREIQVSADISYVGLVLTTATPVAGGVFDLEARDPRGQVVWYAAGLRPNEFDTLTAAVPRSLFRDGTYTVRLIRSSSTPPEVVQEYVFTLRSSP